ncbi:hypothetical protein GGR28_000099 [Lewinella aquimaris]|uniref:DUF7033 domain-containing protein n=1 Tax=Neolewinella aquimaris TaxID=1835722 RepID=A0A840E5V7_9BACT|nr:polysaccharide deacetylase family protein [Neolewinella aquimaris]MBB4077498.1 hypothetical protein [Neolewinella aquimaris]
MSSVPEITVVTAIRHPRLRYVLRIVGDDLGYRFRFSNDRSVFGPRLPRYGINYGGEGPRTLPHHPLLSGRDTGPADPAQLSEDGLPVFCMTKTGPDLLACIFYCLSRYEEYDAFTPDRHGRFTAAASHAVQNGYLHRPVVREWTAAIGRQLRAWFPTLPAPRRYGFTFRPTYDIDLLYAYRHRGWRGGLSGIRDLLAGNGSRFVSRLRATRENDPYNTVAALEDLHRKHELRATYFWLLSTGTNRHDTNPYPIPEAQRALIRRLAATSSTGIHPSYLSSQSPALIGQERKRLEQIAGERITASRQHFLRFRLPDTYRQLSQHGITDDHSMGYADRSGWRAGTNQPFPWYDLLRERETGLTIHPFAAMDVTLKTYEGLSCGAAGAAIIKLAEGLGRYGGPFPLLWHNSSFAADYGWAGWWEMYVDLVGRLAGWEGVTPDRAGPSRPGSDEH